MVVSALRALLFGCLCCLAVRQAMADVIVQYVSEPLRVERDDLGQKGVSRITASFRFRGDAPPARFDFDSSSIVLEPPLLAVRITDGTHEIANDWDGLQVQLRIENGRVITGIIGAERLDLARFRIFYDSASVEVSSEVPGSSQVRSFKASSSRGKWTIARAEPSPAPQADGSFVLVSATTSDSRSLDIGYQVGSADLREPVTIRAFRADSRARNGKWVPIGETTLGPEDLKASDQPQRKRILAGIELLPNMLMPYVVVEAATARGVSAVSFRKYAVAVLAHGYAFDTTESVLNVIEQQLPRVAGGDLADQRDLAWGKLYKTAIEYWARDQGLVAPWVDLMSRSLKARLCFSDAIRVDWVLDSTQPEPDMPRHAASKAKELMLRTRERLVRNPDDVVDWWLVGHSRGGVVVSELLKLLKRSDLPLSGGLVKVVLLDPHPASNAWTPNMSWDSETLLPLSDMVQTTIAKFQAVARDPKIVIPDDASVYQIDLWYQQNEWSKIENGDSSRSNLWGQGPKWIDAGAAGVGINASDLTHRKFRIEDARTACLAGNRDPRASKHCPLGGDLHVSHGDVPEVYRRLVIDATPSATCPP